MFKETRGPSPTFGLIEFPNLISFCSSFPARLMTSIQRWPLEKSCSRLFLFASFYPSFPLLSALGYPVSSCSAPVPQIATPTPQSPILSSFPRHRELMFSLPSQLMCLVGHSLSVLLLVSKITGDKTRIMQLLPTV